MKKLCACDKQSGSEKHTQWVLVFFKRYRTSSEAKLNKDTFPSYIVLKQYKSREKRIKLLVILICYHVIEL